MPARNLNEKWFGDPDKDAKFNRMLEELFRKVNGSITGTEITVNDDDFTLQDDGDSTKQGQFQLSGVSAGTTRVLTWPNADGTIWTSGNDGAGSGLDADLLDGNSSAFFATAADLAAHIADTSAAHAASAIGFTATGNLSSTDVQAAIAELDTEKQPLDSDLTTIAGLSPSNDDIIQRKAGAWTNRTMTQLASDLDSFFLTPAEGNAAYQPLDSDLTAIAALTTTAYGRGLLTLADEDALEALVDTLPNLVSVQGRTVTLADAGANAFFGWDDTAGAYENLTASEALEIIKTVDGAGSGLDADLLDGNSSAFFATASGLSDHLADTSDAHDASAISFSATGNISSTDVQAAIQELDTEKQPIDADLTSWAGVTRASGFDTFVATPSSVNLKSLVTDETGSGALVFADTPTLVTPVIGDATGTSLTLSGDLAVNGGDITSTSATLNVGVAGAPTAVQVGGPGARLGFGVGSSGRRHLQCGGAFTSDGSGNDSAGFVNGSTLTSAAGDTTYVAQFVNAGLIVTQNNSETIAVVAGMRLQEPAITNGTDTITLASTLHIVSAPTEGTTNAALSIAAGDFLTAGNVRIGSVSVAPTVALDVTGAALISTTLGVTGDTTLTGDLAVNGGDVTTSATTMNVFNATATTVNFAGAATTLAVGAATGTLTVNNTTLAAKAGTFSTTLDVTGNTTLTGDLAVNGGDITTTASTFNLANANATTVSIAAGATTAFRIGASGARFGFGNSSVARWHFAFRGSFTSDGGSTTAAGIMNDGDLTGAVGDTDYLTQFANVGSITTQNNSETITVVSGARFEEPVITKGTDTVTLASTVHIVSAPTEGTTNASLSIAAGNALLGGSVRVGSNVAPTVPLDVTGAILGSSTLGTVGAITALNATGIPAGGTAGSGFKFSSTSNFGVFFGSGAPTLSAAKGSLYLRSDGSTTNDRAYINTNGSTTWTALTTVA